MKIQFKLPPGATVTVRAKDGTSIATDRFDSIEVEPFFAMAAGSAEVLLGDVLSNDASRGVVDKFLLAADGRTGKVNRVNRSDTPVVPLIDQPKKPLTGAAAAKAAKTKTE